MAGLILLDLSAAFDTIDQNTLMTRLQSEYGIEGAALNWYESYLTGRTQTVIIHEHKSSPSLLLYGVPQGSVLGPKKFCSYTKPLDRIIGIHNVGFHMYADDTQLYIPLTVEKEKTEAAIQILENCIREVRQWMCAK